MKQTNRIRIALQKSGYLSEESLNLLKRCGIKIRRNNGQLFCHSENFPLDLLLVRDDDIPHLIVDGQCEFGIIGMNVLQETLLNESYQKNEDLVEKVQALDFGACRLVIAVPEKFNYVNLKNLIGKRIATSYPKLLEKFLKRENINAKIIYLQGSVEIAPRLGIADLICDLVATGATLESNNLREITTIFSSQVYLIKNNKISLKEKQQVSDAFIRRISGVLHARESKYIMLHADRDRLKEIISLLPGAEKPTVMPLDEEKRKVALHAVCRENIFWETLEKLKEIGASSILVLPIEKMML